MSVLDESFSLGWVCVLPFLYAPTSQSTLFGFNEGAVIPAQMVRGRWQNQPQITFSYFFRLGGGFSLGKFFIEELPSVSGSGSRGGGRGCRPKPEVHS
jgi:hypothetical protein